MRHTMDRLVGFPLQSASERFLSVVGVKPQNSPSSQTPTLTAQPNRSTPRLALENEEANSDSSQLSSQTGEKKTESVSRPTVLSACLKKARFFAGDEIEFNGIADSAETCQPGQLVVYRVGLDCPLEVVASAMARGAAGILTEQILPAPLTQCIVGDTDRALAEIAAADVGQPDQKILTIGVAGSAGKTTTALAIATVLRDIPCRVAYETSLGSSDGVTTATEAVCKNHGAKLIESLAEAVDAGAAVSIVELNDQALRSGGYSEVKFDLLVVTGRNSTRHDFGPSAIECALEQVMREGAVLVPHDDQATLQLIQSSSSNLGAEVITYGVNNPADVSLKTVSVQDGVLTALLRYESRSAVMESMLGGGMLTDSLAAAAAVGAVTENPLTQVAESLSKLRDLPGRLAHVSTSDWNVDHQNPTCFLDVGGSPDRVAKTLRLLRQRLLAEQPATIRMTSKNGSSNGTSRTRTGRLWCVLAISSQDSHQSLMEYGRLLETTADHAIVTCQESDKASFISLSHGVLDGVQNCAAMRLVADRKRAIAWAHEAASPGDTIVVVGGIPSESPKAQRDTIEQLETFIREAQRNGVSESPEHSSSQKPMLKLFSPEE